MKACGNVFRVFYDQKNKALYQTKPRAFVQRDYLRLELERLSEKIRKRYPKTKPLTAEQWYIANTTDEDVIQYRKLFKEYWQKGEDVGAPHVYPIFICDRCYENYRASSHIAKALPLYTDTLNAIFIRGESFYNKLEDAEIVVRLCCSVHLKSEMSIIEEILGKDWEEVKEFWVEVHSQHSLFNRLINMGFTIFN